MFIEIQLTIDSHSHEVKRFFSGKREVVIRGLTITPFWVLEYTVIPDQDLNFLWSKIDLIVRHVSYFKFDSRAIKPHFHATPGFFSGIGVFVVLV